MLVEYRSTFYNAEPALIQYCFNELSVLEWGFITQ